MHEVELKFQVPPAQRAAVSAAVAGAERKPRVRLQAVYFDTADRALADAGLALRVRREGRRWVQTLKGAGHDSLTRGEHEVPLASRTAELPLADPALHHGTPLGVRLTDALAAAASQALSPLYRTDIKRTSRRLRAPGGSVELAFDEGFIAAGDGRIPVCELEVELKQGSPLAVIATARRWVTRHGLWLDTRSKAERGDLLARSETMAPERKTQAVTLAAGMSLAQGLRCVLLSCLDQVSVNASQVASGHYSAEHVHQLRVGLRRLRTALRLFDAEASHANLAGPAADLFRQLSAARDREAIAQPLLIELRRALGAAGLHIEPPALPVSKDEVDPTILARSAAMQTLLLDLFACTQAELAEPPAADAPALRDRLVQQLNRWHKKAATDAARFAQMDDPARHVLRKRAKRLRYGFEFAATLFGRRQVNGYVKRLRRMQDRLGEFVDTVVGLQAYRDSLEDVPNALFAVGWLAARRGELLRGSEADIAAFAKVKRFWKD